MIAFTASAQDIRNNPNSNHGNKFEQLGTILPTPNEYRTASGAPGPKYWQQKADYTIKCELDEKNLHLTGSETISYFNNSPDILSYLWLQLDENQHNSLRNANYQEGSPMEKKVNISDLRKLEQSKTDNGYGFNIVKLTDGAGKSLPYTINKTMMRIDLPEPLKPGQKYMLKIDWNYNIADRMIYNGRGGYEYFPADGNYLFTMSQFYPRLCVYSDFQGWQNKQFAGKGEFALTFGNFNVQITVPADHVVGATGECQNYQQNLSATQLSRWQKAQSSKEPVQLVTLNEAKAAEKNKSAQKKTWLFKADNVRDFAWTSSRKFVWDAMPAFVEGKKVMCMSYYGKEAYGLYSKFSTKAVAHTIKSYSKFTIPYPYPVAQSVEAANGMEYPMICFNYGRTNDDGTYNEATKYGMIGVIIHEVGHNFFPMIVNSDERQWTWMDEGLNSFTEYLTEELWDNKFPTRRGPAFQISDYMKLPKNLLEPIMTNSENIINFGPNAYSKPAAGLNILRETILGRELFDFAFKEYAKRWAFKHPTPADLFRTLEDATGEDLDWFWRGWFYGIDACDLSIDSVKHFVSDPSATMPMGLTDTTIKMRVALPQLNNFEDISKIRNREDTSISFATDKDTLLRDFYWKYARGLVSIDASPKNYTIPAFIEPLDEATKQKIAGKHFYELQFSNKGGLLMPLILEWTFKDGSKEIDRIAVQVWRFDENHLTKTFMKDKEVASIRLDPMRETADIDESNNTWGNISTPSKFTLYKTKQESRGQSTGVNPMQQDKK
ncbi:MAG: M1 family metallopeptidase [Flavitalea sp.]